MKTMWTVCFWTMMSALLITFGCGDDEEAADDLLGKIKERGTLRVVTDADYAPLSAMTGDTWEGFDVEVAKEVADRLGVQVAFFAGDWDEITAGGWNDRWDISVGSMTNTLERQEVIHFVDPPYYFTPGVFGAAPSASYGSLDDLAGATICVGSATTYLDWLNGSLALPASSIFADPPDNITVITEPTETDCVEGIVAGDKGYDVMISNVALIDGAVREGKLKRVGDPVFSEDLCVAVDKSHDLDSATLRNGISTILQAMHSDGTLSSLSVEYLDADLTQDPRQ